MLIYGPCAQNLEVTIENTELNVWFNYFETGNSFTNVKISVSKINHDSFEVRWHSI